MTFPLATLGSFAPLTSVKAQITPDNSLGAERSVVNPDTIMRDNIPSDRIDGGARRGGNLFHSFQEFNVEAGRGAYFSNPTGVENILTRVTGSNPSNISNISGRLGVLGNANLFLINPHGIVFGQNASLDVRGSFFASTASSLIFNNGFEFSTTNPQAPPLLTVNIPIGLRFRDNPGSITVNGFGQPPRVDGQPSSENPTLKVEPGQTLALVGGNVTLDGGVLQASGGLVELGGLTAAGTVDINSDHSLIFPDGVERADVSLKKPDNGNFSNVDVSGGGSGSIAINARNLDLQQSNLTADISQSSSSPSLRAGDITVDAAETITLGQSSQIESTVLSNATGNGSNINITTGSISMMDHSALNTFTFGQGNAGNVNVNARDNLSFDGSTSGIVSIAQPQSTGNAGDINIINTGTLSLNHGAGVFAISNGQGKSGSVTINARDFVSLLDGTNIYSRGNNGGGGISITTGTLSLTNALQFNTSTSGMGNAGDVTINARDRVSLDNSKIIASANSTATGKGGNVTITSGDISLTNGSLIILATAGKGNAGNALLNTRSLSLTNGSQLNASSVDNSPGNGGAIQIKATEFVSLSGSSPMDGRYTQISTATSDSSTGNGGNITIDTNALRLSDGATINATTTSSGNGGNIKLQIGDLLQLRRQSGISTSASSNASAGNGGNIKINAPLIVAFPSNNDIAANASRGTGGQVTINTQGLFGIAPLSRTELERRLNTRDPSQLNPDKLSTNDITAFSQQSPSLNGTIIINTSYLNPSQSLVELPKNVVDPTTQIAQNPCQHGAGSTFAITGRGGIPSNPNQTLASDNVRVGLVTPASNRGTAKKTALIPSTKPTVKKAVPVQGWIFNDKGQVVLTAYDPTKTGSQRPWRTPASCAKR